jgi:hypothetical protein
VQVVDYGRGRFTLVAKSAAAGVRDGQMVRLRHDRERGLVLEIDRGISR